MLDRPRSSELTNVFKDFLAARAGDSTAGARLTRTLVPAAIRAAVPQLGIAVDIAAAAFDELMPKAAPDGDYSTPGSEAFVQWMAARDWGLFIVLGAPGSGKTTFACRLTDLWPTPHKYIIGVDPRALEGTPLRAIPFRPTTIARLPAGSVLVVPDSGLYLDAREFGSDQEQVIRKIAQIVRHRRLRCVFDGQYSSLLAKSMFLCQAIFWKPLGIAWRVTEREGMLGLARASQEAWAEIPPTQRKKWIYAMSDEAGFMGMVGVSLPEWWNEQISTSHAGDDIIDAEFREIE